MATSRLSLAFVILSKSLGPLKTTTAEDFRQPLDSRVRCCGFADIGVRRLECGIDDLAALAIRQEGALHRVNSNPLEILQAQTECFRRHLEFPSQVGITH